MDGILLYLALKLQLTIIKTAGFFLWLEPNIYYERLTAFICGGGGLLIED